MKSPALGAAAALALAACAPDPCPADGNLTVTNAEYVAFVSSASPSLARADFDPDAFPDAYHLDCRGLAPPEGLPIPVDLCDDWPPAHEIWAARDGYYVVHEDVTACSPRAALTADGGLELSFEHRLFGGALAQFALSIVPDFAPDTGAGDWLAAWSRELDWVAAQADAAPGAFDHLVPYLDDGQLWFLDSGSYQIDPRNPARALPMPSEWYAGPASARFVDEALVQRPTYYAEPRAYYNRSATTTLGAVESDELYYCDLDAGADPTSDGCMQALGAELQATSLATYGELDRLFRRWDTAEPYFGYAPIPHLNDWRAADGFADGLDAWGQLAYSYVVLAEGSEVSPGGSASGAFTVVFDAEPGLTRVFLRGEFSTAAIE